jgi:hypothetical protein
LKLARKRGKTNPSMNLPGRHRKIVVARNESRLKDLKSRHSARKDHPDTKRRIGKHKVPVTNGTETTDHRGRKVGTLGAADTSDLINAGSVQPGKESRKDGTSLTRTDQNDQTYHHHHGI